MNKITLLLMIGIPFWLLSCKQAKKETNTEIAKSGYIGKIKNLPDSVSIQGITIKNLFKSQILAHQGTKFDSMMIVEKVYRPHQALWDNCYGMIFGEENASKFNNPAGMIEWNRTLYLENKNIFDDRAKQILAIDIDSTLKTNLKKFTNVVPYKPKAQISILFTPLQGIGFGGCSNSQFCFELNNIDYDVAYTIEKGIPHELNHLAYDPLRLNDPKKNSALRLTIDEGFACYFTWVFFDRQISKYEAVENMSDSDWNWYLKHEKQLFTELKKYFDDESGDNPLLRNDKFRLFKDAPKSLNYWLGFRIIEKYVEKNGEDSWKEIYTLNVEEVLKESGYEQYISELD